MYSAAANNYIDLKICWTGYATTSAIYYARFDAHLVNVLLTMPYAYFDFHLFVDKSSLNTLFDLFEYRHQRKTLLNLIKKFRNKYKRASMQISDDVYSSQDQARIRYLRLVLKHQHQLETLRRKNKHFLFAKALTNKNQSDKIKMWG